MQPLRLVGSMALRQLLWPGVAASERCMVLAGTSPLAAAMSATSQHQARRFSELSRVKKTAATPERRSSSFQEQKRKALGLPEGQDPGDALTVQPSESKASLQQVASVVGHSALIVTRPVEWCVRGTTGTILNTGTIHSTSSSWNQQCISSIGHGSRFRQSWSDNQLKAVKHDPGKLLRRILARCGCRGTVIFGYEQANRYTIYDEQGQVVAQLMEDYQGLGNEVGRQILRTRRSFTATVFSGDGTQVIFRLRRPMYLINSTMYIEDGEGNTLGEIRQRWHPIKRNYDLYMGKAQFASISGNFLAWEFELKDAQGGTLALLDRNFQGFGKELFTDAGKYVIHFGHSPTQAAQLATNTVVARSGGQAQHPVTPMAVARTDVAVIPTVTGNQLAVVRQLQLEERMVVLAAAISVDYDFFSQHSHGSGWFHPPLILPFPGGGGVPAGAEVPPQDMDNRQGPAGAAGAGAAGEAAQEGTGGGFPSAGAGGGGGDGGGMGPMGSQGQGSGDMHLGGDEFTPPPSGGQGDGWGGGGDGEMKWDLPSSSGDGGGESGASGGLIAAIWAFISGGD